MKHRSAWARVSTAIVVSLTTVVAFLATTLAQQAVPEIAQMVADAKTPADHQAIAAYYDKASKDALNAAEVHRRLLHAYTDNANRPDYKPLPSHCKQEIQFYEGLAKEDESLAAAHRAMAKNTPP